MSGPTKLLTESLTRFYGHPSHADVLCSIATGKSDVSLRLVEWFVSSEREISLDYRARLRAYTRRLFDPFRRSDRIVMDLGEDRMFETTLGQMNFVKWLIEEGHWTRLTSERAALTAAMLAESKDKRPAKAPDKGGKRHETAEGPIKSWKPQLLTFN
jgi:hypothetical protein